MTDPKLTPPLDAVEQWAKSSPAVFKYVNWDYELHIATKAAQWGANRELDACCEWLLIENNQPCSSGAMRAARRPEPQTLNSIALEMLGTIEKMDVVVPEITDTIRRALEQLND